MAQKAIIAMEDDLYGRPAAETVPQIDLSAHTAPASGQLAGFIEYARKARRRPGRPATAART